MGFHIIAEKCVMYCLASGLKTVPRMANTLSRGVFTSVGREMKVFSGLLTVGFGGDSDVQNDDTQKRYLTTPRQNPMLPLIIGVGIAGVCLASKSIVEVGAPIRE